MSRPRLLGIGIGFLVSAAIFSLIGRWTFAATYALLGVAVCITWFGLTLADSPASPPSAEPGTDG